MKNHLLKFTALSLLISSPAFADAETEALRAQVKALEARLNALEKKQSRGASHTSVATPAPAAVEQRLAIVERKQENAEEAAQTKAKETPKVEIGSKGLSVTSADKQYGVTMRAYAQLDNRTFVDNGTTNGTSGFLIRSARPIIDAKMTDYFNARFMWDFGQGNTRLLDAYGDFHPIPGKQYINFRLGQFKSPVGLERMQSEQDLLFVERGLTTNLVPFRDEGLMAYGSLIPDYLDYQVAYLNGANDLQVNTGDADNHKDFAGRLLTYPLRWSNIEFLRGFGTAIAGTYGQHTGSSTAANLSTGFVSMGQNKFFDYNSGVYANGTQWRVNPQAYFYKGPFSVLGEYVVNGQDVRVTTHDRTLKNTAWIGMASYVLTGEDASFEGVKPENPLWPGKDGYGAVELTARAGSLTVDRDAFPLYASIASDARQADEYAFGVNWYLNTSVKLNVDYAWTTFDGGAAAGRDRPTERVALTRTQIRF